MKKVCERGGSCRLSAAPTVGYRVGDARRVREASRNTRAFDVVGAEMYAVGGSEFVEGVPRLVVRRHTRNPPVDVERLRRRTREVFELVYGDLREFIVVCIGHTGEAPRVDVAREDAVASEERCVPRKAADAYVLVVGYENTDAVAVVAGGEMYDTDTVVAQTPEGVHRRHGAFEYLRRGGRGRRDDDITGACHAVFGYDLVAVTVAVHLLDGVTEMDGVGVGFVQRVCQTFQTLVEAKDGRGVAPA